MNSYRVLVTGANRGLGYHLAEKFEQHGSYVLRHLGSKDADLTLVSDVNMLIGRAKKADINVVVNNAAITCPGKVISQYTPDEIRAMIYVDLVAPMILVNALVDSLKLVININSMVGLEVKAKRTVYSAAKWGLRGFSQALAAETPDLQVLDVYPTNIKTTVERTSAMDVDYVISEIFQAVKSKKQILVLDGRAK